jgi:hypothetical protein
VLPVIALSTLLVSQCWDLSGTASADVPFTIHTPVCPAAVGTGRAPGPSRRLLDPQVVPASAQEELLVSADALAAEASAAEAPPPGTASPGYVTREELQSEVRKMAWRKGDFTVVPYCTIWGSMSYDSQRCKIGDYALWFESPELHPDDPDFNVDAKSTRVGLDFVGPGIPLLGAAALSGKVEVDFQGQFVTRNKPGLLLRHAYVEAQADDLRWLVGQTWDVISPLGIPTLNYTAGSAVGNLAYRRAQFRAERDWKLCDTFMLTLQGSVNANVVTDFVTDSATTTSADPGPYPDFQSRVAFTLGQRECPDLKPIVLGVGGHCGIQNFDFRTAPTELDVDIPTYSLATDFVVPVTQRWGVQGEFFTGFNLSNYMGGILQGVDRTTHRGIHATGGWIDLYVDWLPCLHTHSGFALDDPLDHDMTSGRTRNQMLFNNVTWDANKNLQFAFEVDVWETHYLTLAPGEGVRFEFVTKYRF